MGFDRLDRVFPWFSHEIVILPWSFPPFPRSTTTSPPPRRSDPAPTRRIFQGRRCSWSAADWKTTALRREGIPKGWDGMMGWWDVMRCLLGWSTNTVVNNIYIYIYLCRGVETSNQVVWMVGCHGMELYRSKYYIYIHMLHIWYRDPTALVIEHSQNLSFLSFQKIGILKK